MRVAICCKGVPVDVGLESLHIAEGDIYYKDTEFYINEADAYALEAAVTLKSSYKVETVALTAGPLRAQEVLYIALAKGIDQVMRIDAESSLPELISQQSAPTLEGACPSAYFGGCSV